MKINNLTKGSKVYTSNVFFVLGSWNAIEDRNTLVDVGADPNIVSSIEKSSTGVGKKRVEQVVLTHDHFDHTSMLPLICEHFHPEVCAFSEHAKGVDRILRDGDHLKMGDRVFQVIHTPGHSSDSICLYCEEDKILFVGDTPVLIRSADGAYENDFIEALQKIARRDIEVIHFGHGESITENGKSMIKSTLRNVRQAVKTAIKID